MSCRLLLVGLTLFLSLTSIRAEPHSDAHGDPLPEGALARLGSVRWRHPGGIRNSCLSPDKNWLATTNGPDVIVWDAETGRRVHQFPHPLGSTFASPAIVFSADGSRLAYCGSAEFACVWDLKTGEELRRFTEGGYNYGFIDFTPDGKKALLSTHESTEVRDIKTGKLQRTLSEPAVNMLSSDHHIWVRVQEKDKVILGDVETGERTSEWIVHTASNGIQEGIAFSPDRKRVAIVNHDGTIQVRDRKTGKVVQSFPLPKEGREEIAKGRYWEYRLGFVADGKQLWIGCDRGVIYRYDLVAEKELLPLHIGTGTIAAFHTLADGETVLITTSDGWIRHWDLKSGKETSDFQGYKSAIRATLSPNGHRAVVVSKQGRVDVWNTLTQKHESIVKLREDDYPTPIWLSDERILLCSAPHALEEWDIGKKKRIRVVQWKKLENGGPAWMQADAKHRHLFLAGGADVPLTSINLETGEVIWRDEKVSTATLSPDNRTIAATNAGKLRLLDAQTGKVRSETTIVPGDKIPFGQFPSLGYSPDGRLLALGDRMGNVIIWDLLTKTRRSTFKAVDPPQRRFPLFKVMMNGSALEASRPVYSLAFAANGQWLATGGHDGSVRLWEVVTGHEVLRRDGHISASVVRVSFGPRGQRLLSAGGDMQALLWSLEPSKTGENLSVPEAWDALQSDEGVEAHRAIWRMLDDPQTTVKLLQEQLPPAKPLPGQKAITKLIEQLDSPRFAVRRTAEEKLAEMGRRVVGSLRQALKTPKSEETERRLRKLIHALDGPPTHTERRAIRAVQVAEWLPDDAGRDLLRDWAKGAEGAILTEAAKDALRQLK